MKKPVSPRRTMRVCIVGASGKLGQYMVQHALARGYEVAGVCREQSVGKLDGFKGRITVVPGATNDPCQPHARAVVRQVAAGTDRDFEHFALRLRADPLAAAAEEQPLEDAHLPVVLVRLPLVKSEDPLRLALATSVRRLSDAVSHLLFGGRDARRALRSFAPRGTDDGTAALEPRPTPCPSPRPSSQPSRG